MKTKCYSVRLAGLTPISPKAYRAESFDGRTDIIPASQVFGEDMDVEKSDAWWISAWILEKKDIQYSAKKVAWFDTESRAQLPSVTVTTHKAGRHAPVEDNSVEGLRR